MRPIKLTLWLSFFAGLLTVASLTAKEPTVAPEQRLRERATEYWQAAQSRDLSTMYRMELAAKQGRLTPDKARNTLGTSAVLSYEFGSFDVNGDEAEVVVNVKYRLPDLRAPVPVTRRDPWTLLEGDWYHGRAGVAPKSDESSPR